MDHGKGLVELGSRRSERCLLGLLLLDAAIGATTVNRLANLLWGDEPPASSGSIRLAASIRSEAASTNWASRSR